MRNPKWWNRDNDSAWERVKAAFKRDWDQTKHDFGGNEPDTDQDVGDTVKQAAGKQAIPPRRQPVYEDVEPAYRFGYGARSHYGKQYSNWDDKLEAQLKRDWEESYEGTSDWATTRRAVRMGWEYKE